MRRSFHRQTCDWWWWVTHGPTWWRMTIAGPCRREVPRCGWPTYFNNGPRRSKQPCTRHCGDGAIHGGSRWCVICCSSRWTRNRHTTGGQYSQQHRYGNHIGVQLTYQPRGGCCGYGRDRHVMRDTRVNDRILRQRLMKSRYFCPGLTRYASGLVTCVVPLTPPWTHVCFGPTRWNT